MLRQSLSPHPGAPRRVAMTVDVVGGIWRYAVDAAEALNALGIEVVLVVVGPAPGAGHLAEVERLPATALAHLDEPLDWMVTDEAALSRLAPRLADLVDRLRIDLLQVNVPSQAANLAVGCPVVAVAHSCVATWWRAVKGGDLPPAWAWQARRTRAGLLRADAVVTPSRAHADATLEAYGPLPGVFVVANASRPPTGPDRAKQPVALSAGRWWDEGKGARVLDAAAADIAWPVMMAGPLTGPQGGGVSLVHARALGAIPSSDLGGLMARAAIFVSPSLYEPFGLAVLEAAYAGCALVLSDIPTFRELWDGAAVFAEPGDPAALARQIVRLTGDDDLRRTLGAEARRKAHRFTLERTADGLLAAYRAAGRAAARGRPIAAE